MKDQLVLAIQEQKKLTSATKALKRIDWINVSCWTCGVFSVALISVSLMLLML